VESEAIQLEVTEVDVVRELDPQNLVAFRAFE